MEQNKCYLKQENKCVLCLWRPCMLCSYKIKAITGMSEMKDYVNLVVSKNNSRRAYLIACLSLLISALMLFLKILETFKQCHNIEQKDESLSESTNNRSLLDVEGINTNITTKELVNIVREQREL